ncbi:MAG: LysM peptidoglycan-binding protein [Actinomycetia bacterium]|nr:LysM peptidoglycan-binding protein [Actinomycetes bacterium]
MRAPRALVLLVAFALVASAGTYTVRRGDTLGGIAGRAGVPIGLLASANHLGDPNRLREGQVLTIPTGRPATAAAAPSVTVHRVARGETLGAIARRYRTTVARLAQLNGIGDVNRVREGTVLRLDGGARWVCPVHGMVAFVSGFGEPRGGGRRHEGVDVAAPRGTPVVANVAGTIEHHVNPRGGNAYYLKGDDGDTYYGAHLQNYIGPEGRVALGQIIGQVGSSGNAAGGIDHLHFERMPKGGPSVDPAPLLLRACPRRGS